MLFSTEINVLFGISTSNNAGISKIYTEKQVVLHSLTFTLKSANDFKNNLAGTRRKECMPERGRVSVGKSHTLPEPILSPDWETYSIIILQCLVKPWNIP